MVEAILPSSWYYLHLPLSILIPLSLLLMSFSWGQLWPLPWPIINIIKVWYRQISKKAWKKRFTNTWELLQKWHSQPSWCILGKGFVGWWERIWWRFTLPLYSLFHVWCKSWQESIERTGKRAIYTWGNSPWGCLVLWQICSSDKVACS